MVNGQRKYTIISRNYRKFQANSKKGYHAIKKTEKKTASTTLKHRIYTSEDGKNRKNKTHTRTHNR